MGGREGWGKEEEREGEGWRRRGNEGKAEVRGKGRKREGREGERPPLLFGQIEPWASRIYLLLEAERNPVKVKVKSHRNVIHFGGHICTCCVCHLSMCVPATLTRKKGCTQKRMSSKLRLIHV